MKIWKEREREKADVFFIKFVTSFSLFFFSSAYFKFQIVSDTVSWCSFIFTVREYEPHIRVIADQIKKWIERNFHLCDSTICWHCSGIIIDTFVKCPAFCLIISFGCSHRKHIEENTLKATLIFICRATKNVWKSLQRAIWICLQLKWKMLCKICVTIFTILSAKHSTIA